MTYADMADWSAPLQVTRKPARIVQPRDVAGAVALAITVSLGGWLLATRGDDGRLEANLPSLPVPSAVLAKTRVALDPFLSIDAPVVALADSVPLAARFVAIGPAAPVSAPAGDVAADSSVEGGSPVVTVADATQPAATAEAVPAPAIPLPPMPPVVEREDAAMAATSDAAAVPLPMPRPPALGAVAAAPVVPRAPMRLAMPRGAAPPSANAVATAAPADNRNFLQKLFGAGSGNDQPPSGPALAYASPESNLFGNMFRGGGTGNPLTLYDRYTAVYDISAHTVYLPGGNRLEAHSGLGELIDDPRHVSTRNRGATPPHMYELSLRESRFHGVQALRLKPVGEGTVYGRDGLLAHTFMLGPNGDSNGCVSFRNYRDFLGAFQRGEVRRLAVVARLS